MTPFVVSLVVTFVAAPGVRCLMLHRGIIDIPNYRSSHVRPTPRGGGLACLLGVLGALVLAYAAGRAVPWVASAAIALALVGFADDRFDLAPALRLGAQVAAGALMGFAAGGGWLVAAGALIAPVVVNVVNFMDGINGITSLSAGVWGATAWIVGMAAGVEEVWVIGAATAGAAIGFLPWNAPSARLFLGDVGSYLFGGLIAAGIVVGLATNASAVVLSAPLALYLADTGTVLLRRIHRREHLMTAHREHTYQRLACDPRLPHVVVSALVAGLATIASLAWFALPAIAAVGVTMTLAILYVASPQLWASPVIQVVVAPRALNRDLRTNRNTGVRDVP